MIDRELNQNHNSPEKDSDLPTPSSELVRVGNQALTRYSSVLVHRGWSLAQVLTRTPTAIEVQQLKIRLAQLHQQTWECVYQLKAHTDGVYALALNPNGEAFASSGNDGEIKLWHLYTGELKQSLTGHSDAVFSLAFHPDQHTLISGSNDATIKVWNLQQGKAVYTFKGHRSAVLAVHLSGDGTWLVSGSSDETVKIWDLSAKKLRHTLKGHEDEVLAVLVSLDQQTVWSASQSEIRQWHLETGELLQTITQGDAPIAIASEILASSHEGSRIKLWHRNTCQLQSIYYGFPSLSALNISPVGQILACGDSDGDTKILDLRTGKLLHILAGHQETVWAIAMPHSRTLATASEDGTIHIWRVAQQEEGETMKNNPIPHTRWSCVYTLSGHSDCISGVALTPDAQTLASGSEDGTIRLWNPYTGTLLQTLEGDRDGVYSVAIHPNGSLLASSGHFDHSIKVWDLSTQDLLYTLDGFGSLAMSADGRILVSSGGGIDLWDLETGSLIQNLGAESGVTQPIAISSDGKVLAWGDKTGKIKLWDLQTLEVLRIFFAHDGSVDALAFEPHGNRLVSGGEDSLVKIWNWQTGEKMRSLSGHSSNVASLSFSRGGKLLATASSEVLIWDFNSNQLVGKLDDGAVSPVAFSPDGKTLASGYDDGTNYSIVAILQEVPVWKP